MAISEFEIKRIEKVVGNVIEERRPPVHARNEFDIGFRIDNQSVFILNVAKTGVRNLNTTKLIMPS